MSAITFSLSEKITFQYNDKAKIVEVPVKYSVWQAVEIYVKKELQIPSLKRMKFQIEGDVINPNLSIAFYKCQLFRNRIIIKISEREPLSKFVADLRKLLTAQEMVDLSDMLAEKAATVAQAENAYEDLNKLALVAVDLMNKQ